MKEGKEKTARGSKTENQWHMQEELPIQQNDAINTTRSRGPIGE
jgi:hypothetical protein